MLSQWLFCISSCPASKDDGRTEEALKRNNQHSWPQLAKEMSQTMWRHAGQWHWGSRLGGCCCSRMEWVLVSWWWAIVLCISFCIVLHHSLSKYSYLDPQSLVLLPFLILCSIPLRVKESKRLYGAELLAGLNHSTCSFGNAGTVHLGSWYNDWESPTWSQWF